MSGSRVVFMCGPAGAGKSTVARELEAHGMTRLSIDTEAWSRGHREMPLAEDVRRAIEQELRERLMLLVAEGRDVVIDLSFWSRRMRADYRALLAPLGVVPETIYLDVPRSVALNRIRARRAAHADDFAISAELAAEYFDHFEPPTPDEGPLRVVRHESWIA